METIAVDLELKNNVSGPASRAAASLQGVEKSAAKAQRALNFGPELAKTEKQLKRLKVDPEGYKRLVQAQKELAEHQKKLGGGGFLDSFKERFSGIGKIATGSFIGELFAHSLIEGTKKAVEVLTEGVKKAFEAGIKAEQQDLSIELTLGKEEAKKFSEDIDRFAPNTSFGDSDIKGSMLMLRRAGFGQDSARQAFSTASDIAAMQGQGGNIGAVNQVLSTFKAIQTKQGIGRKGLTEILGDVGQTIPEFYKALGKKLRVSAKQAESMAETGKVGPQLLMNMITGAVNKMQGGAAGTSGIMHSQTLGSRLSALQALPEKYLEQVSKSPAWARLSDRMGDVLKQLSPDSPRGKKIVDALIRMFEKITEAINRIATPENIDKFAAGIESAAAGIAAIPDYLEEIMAVLPAVGIAATAALAPLGAIAAPILAAVAAATALYTAFERIQSTATELGGWGRVWKDVKAFASGEQPATANDTVNANSPMWKRERTGKSINVTNHINVTTSDKAAAQRTFEEMDYTLERADRTGG